MCTCIPPPLSSLDDDSEACECLSKCLCCEEPEAEESECLGVINMEVKLLAAEEVDSPCVGEEGGEGELLEPEEGATETESEAEVGEATSGTLSVSDSGTRVVVVELIIEGGMGRPLALANDSAAHSLCRVSPHCFNCCINPKLGQTRFRREQTCSPALSKSMR